MCWKLELSQDSQIIKQTTANSPPPPRTPSAPPHQDAGQCFDRARSARKISLQIPVPGIFFFLEEENPGTRDFSHMPPPLIRTQVKSLCRNLPKGEGVPHPIRTQVKSRYPGFSSKKKKIPVPGIFYIWLLPLGRRSMFFD